MYTKDLTHTTFIIPLRIEHEDRYRNAQTILGFLNHHFRTNVFIYEISEDGKSKLDFLDDLDNLQIRKWISDPDFFEPHSGKSIFHRTKYLNIMLDEVQTPVVCNYDIDVLLEPKFYIFCQDKIMSGDSHSIYPFKFGTRGQIQVCQGFDYKKFKDGGFNLDQVKNESVINYYDSEYGHCIFFDTKVYKNNGAENENFISYGPEDKERGLRFQKLGYKVNWINESFVYHFEHFRGLDSGSSNPYFSHNWKIFDYLDQMSDADLKDYYQNQDYTKKYKTIGKA